MREGAKKFLTINVINAKSLGSAKCGILCSQLTLSQTASQEDPNWGRILIGIGKSGEIIDTKKLKIKIGKFIVLKMEKFMRIITKKN